MRLLLLGLLACGAPVERTIVDAGPRIPLRDILGLELRGPDFEEARGKGCPLEAIIEESDAGPVLHFRCTVWAAP